MQVSKKEKNMKRLYGLQTDKENVTLSINEDKAMLTIQTADAIKVRELDLQSDVKSDKSASLEEIKPIKIDASGITVGNIDGNGEGENIIIDALQTNILAGKLDYLETKLKEKDEEISKLKYLTNTKVSSKEFWNFVKYYSEKQQTKVNLNLGSKDYQLIVDALKRRDEDPLKELI